MAAQILLADSNETVVQALGDYLEELGFGVHRSQDKEGTIGLVENHDIRLAIVALNFPEDHCRAIFDNLKEKSPSIECIVMVGEEDLTTTERVGAEDSFAFLLKPFDERTLERIVRSALNKQEALSNKDRLIKQLISKTKRLEALVVEQEKRVAELESSKRQAESIFKSNQRLKEKLHSLEQSFEKSLDVSKVASAESIESEQESRVTSSSRSLLEHALLILISVFSIVILFLLSIILFYRNDLSEAYGIICQEMLYFDMLLVSLALVFSIKKLKTTSLSSSRTSENSSHREKFLIYTSKISTVLGLLTSFAWIVGSSYLFYREAYSLRKPDNGFFYWNLSTLALPGAAILLLIACLADSFFVRSKQGDPLASTPKDDSARIRLETL